MVFIKKVRLCLILKSDKGFILTYMLTYFMFFVTFISMTLIQKQLSLRQTEFYNEANSRIQVEKEIFKIISQHNTFPQSEELIISGHKITIKYDESILINICNRICYKMIVEFDQNSKMIINSTYE
jgi:hypothetical protein